jgi:hypothetical protein
LACATLTRLPPQRRARGSASNATFAANVSDSSWPRREAVVGVRPLMRGRRTRFNPRLKARSVRSDLHGLRREVRFADLASRRSATL